MVVRIQGWFRVSAVCKADSCEVSAEAKFCTVNRGDFLIYAVSQGHAEAEEVLQRGGQRRFTTW